MGVREPVSLAISYHTYATRAQAAGKSAREILGRLQRHWAAALQTLKTCDAAHGGGLLVLRQQQQQPPAMRSMPTPAHRAYVACLSAADRSTSGSVGHTSGGLYALKLSSFLRNGFEGPQFMLVPTTALSHAEPLARALAAFLELPLRAAQAPSVSQHCTARRNAQRETFGADRMQKPAFYHEARNSSEGARLAAFFEPHSRALLQMIGAHGVRTAGPTEEVARELGVG